MAKGMGRTRFDPNFLLATMASASQINVVSKAHHASYRPFYALVMVDDEVIYLSNPFSLPAGFRYKVGSNVAPVGLLRCYKVVLL